MYTLRLCLVLLVLFPTALWASSLDEMRSKANQGDALAQFRLGVKYAKGDGVSKNEEEAVRWYRKAAEQGSAKAQYNLGVRYGGFTRSTVLQKNYQQAYKWLDLAAAQGHEKAGNFLDLVSIKLSPVKKKRVKREPIQKVVSSVAPVEQPPIQGSSADAQTLFKRAVQYAKGRGVDKDERQALSLYHQAAELGSAAAQYNLGIRYGGYTHHKIVPVDYQEAYHWLDLASANGHARAAVFRDKIASIINNAQATKARLHDVAKKKAKKNPNKKSPNKKKPNKKNGRVHTIVADKEAVHSIDCGRIFRVAQQQLEESNQHGISESDPTKRKHLVLQILRNNTSEGDQKKCHDMLKVQIAQ